MKREWAIHGIGEREVGGEEEETLFEGTWETAGEYCYPFSLDLPNGPFSYDGEKVSLDWFVRAEADLEWNIEPRGDRSFLLRPGLEPGEDSYQVGIAGSYLGPGEPKIESEVSPKTTTLLGAWATLIGLLLLGLGCLILGLWLVLLGVEPVDLVVIAIAGAIFAFSGAGAVYGFKIRTLKGEAALGRVSVDLDRTRFSPGEEVEIIIEIVPQDLIHLEVVQFTLMCQEETDTGVRGETFIAARRIAEESRVISDSLDVLIDKEEVLTLRETIRIPEEGPYSFASVKSSLRWSLMVDVILKKWPRWTRRIDVEVVPNWRTESAEDNSPEEAQLGQALEEVPEEVLEESQVAVRGDETW